MEKRLALKSTYDINYELDGLLKDGDLYAHMEQIMEKCDDSLRGLSMEEYKAILISVVIDCFGRGNYSDYLLAMFGLLQGYDDETMKLTDRRRKYLLEKSCAYGDGKYNGDKLPSKDDATNYKRTINEEDIIGKLAVFLADIEDWDRYISGREYLSVLRRGKSEHGIAALPTPYYTVRQKFVPGEIVPSEQMLASLATSILKTLFVSGDSVELEIQDFKTAPFEIALENLRKQGSMSYREYHECMNFLEVVKEAAKNLHEDDEPVKMDAPYDFDWFLRFFDAVANISNEDMRKLWGKVLAGEVKSQSSFSLRTIETLRNMRRGEANVFRYFANASGFPITFYDNGELTDIHDMVPLHYVIPTIIVQKKNEKDTFSNQLDGNRIDSEILDSYDLRRPMQSDYGLREMQDCGLIDYVEEEHIAYLDTINLGFIIGGDTVVIIKCTQTRNDIVYAFTYKSLHYHEAARQIYPIIGARAKLDEVISIIKKWQNNLDHIKDCKIEISLHRIRKKMKCWLPVDSHIDIEDENLLDARCKS